MRARPSSLLPTPLRPFLPPSIPSRRSDRHPRRMLASREKLRTHRKKKLEKSASVKLVAPMAAETSGVEKVRDKIKISTNSRSALVPGEGRSMGMDID